MNIPRARGAVENPPNRFERYHLEPDPEADLDPDAPGPRTEFFEDHAQTIINYNDSPDIGFRASINPYRGCEHGCSYCFARPMHEYLGMSAGLDFESRIFIKTHAPELLRDELSAKKWRPQVIAMSTATDCYQPVERRLRLTRRCLEVLAEFCNPVGIITKNFLVTRDIDLLASLAAHQAVCVNISLTSLDAGLAAKLEPRASLPAHRLAAIRQLSQAGIPTAILIAPVIPALNEVEIPAILDAARQAGAVSAGYVPLRLPYGVKEIFQRWLEDHYPSAKDKILNQLRAMRQGRLNDPEFGSRMEGSGPSAERLAQLFEICRRRAGFGNAKAGLSTAAFKPPGQKQLTFF